MVDDLKIRPRSFFALLPSFRRVVPSSPALLSLPLSSLPLVLTRTAHSSIPCFARHVDPKTIVLSQYQKFSCLSESLSFRSSLRSSHLFTSNERCCTGVVSQRCVVTSILHVSRAMITVKTAGHGHLPGRADGTCDRFFDFLRVLLKSFTTCGCVRKQTCFRFFKKSQFFFP